MESGAKAVGGMGADNVFAGRGKSAEEILVGGRGVVAVEGDEEHEQRADDEARDHGRASLGTRARLAKARWDFARVQDEVVQVPHAPAPGQ